MSERIDDPTFQEYNLVNNNGYGGLGYNIDQHANDTIGPPTITQQEHQEATQIFATSPLAQQGQLNQPAPPDYAVKGRIENVVKAPVETYRTQSDTPYKVLNVSETKNGTIVHVNEYPNQKRTPAEKADLAKGIGVGTGVIAAIPGGVIGAASDTMSVAGMALGVYSGYDAGKALGTAAAKDFLTAVDPSLPVTKYGDVTYVRVR